MIELDVPQGSEEWRRARAGVVTASALEKILTPKGWKPSAQRGAYICRLAAEIISGEPIDDPSTPAMERGRELEPEAAAWYAFDRGVEVREVGFFLRDDRRVGCSPDRLVGEDGGLEVKVPLPQNHIRNVLDPDGFVEEHAFQVQTCLLVTGRKWWDLLSYHPTFPKVVERVLPDPTWRKAVEPAVEDFLRDLDAAVATIRAKGGASCNPLL